MVVEETPSGQHKRRWLPPAEFEDLKRQVERLTLILNEQIRRLDAVQDLAIAVSGYTRLLDKMFAEYAAGKTTPKPVPGPEVG